MICMELMDKSLHALYRLVYEQLHQSIPLPVLGKMAESVIIGDYISLTLTLQTVMFTFHFRH